MKRARALIPEIACFDNLHLAFYKAKKGKEYKLPVIAYRKHLRANLADLRHQILTGKVDVGNYHYFTIYDPKQRQICAAAFKERVLHHALMNVCHPYFEKYQIFDSYATRIGKGTFKALDRAAYFQKQNKWCQKFDVRKFFDNILHHTLFNMLEHKFKDEVLLGIFGRIIDSYHTKPGGGVPIGNLTSQYFANHYLGLLDHFIKNKLQLRAYIRYMDDFIIWHNSKEILNRSGKTITAFLAEKLGLYLKTSTLNHASRGVAFLGYRVFPEKIYLATRSRKRYRQKLEKFVHLVKNEIWSQDQFQKHAMALNSFAFHANSYYFRKNVLLNLGQ